MVAWIVVRFNPMGWPAVESREVLAIDAANAILSSGFPQAEIVSVRVKALA